MRSRWYRSRPRSNLTATRSRRPAWRSAASRTSHGAAPAAETVLRGQRADASAFAQAADILLRGAKGYGHNDFKIGLARRAIVRTLSQAARGTPQSQSDKKIR